MKYWKSTGNQLGFYWINGDQLVTVINSVDPGFVSDDNRLIWNDGMKIRNKRYYNDYACLYNSSWSGILVGIDGYPATNGFGSYYIAGADKD